MQPQFPKKYHTIWSEMLHYITIFNLALASVLKTLDVDLLAAVPFGESVFLRKYWVVLPR